MPDARAYAISLLEARVDMGIFCPALQLSLGMKYGVDAWVSPALRKFALMKPEDISTDDAHLMGLDHLYLIFRLQSQILSQRAYMAFCPFKIQHAATCAS